MHIIRSLRNGFKQVFLKFHWGTSSLDQIAHLVTIFLETSTTRKTSRQAWCTSSMQQKLFQKCWLIASARRESFTTNTKLQLGVLNTYLEAFEMTTICMAEITSLAVIEGLGDDNNMYGWNHLVSCDWRPSNKAIKWSWLVTATVTYIMYRFISSPGTLSTMLTHPPSLYLQMRVVPSHDPVANMLWVRKKRCQVPLSTVSVVHNCHVQMYSAAANWCNKGACTSCLG